jgi:type I restriction enzyme S subunit
MNSQTDLKSLIQISKDGEWGKGEPFDNSLEMLVIRGTDFDDASVGDLEDLPVRFIPLAIAERKTLKPYDILIETAGGSGNRPTGRSMFLKPSVWHRAKLPLTCASFSRFIRIDPEKANPEFIYWCLQNKYTGGVMWLYNTRHTGVARFQYTVFSEREVFDLPPLPIQHKIAEVLSAYDDLIEVNTRRIRILEQITKTVYHEWFGKIDAQSLPKGWSMKTLDYVLSEIESGSRPKGGIDPNQRGVPSIGAENIIGLGQYNYASEKYVSTDFFNAMTRGHIKNKDVLIYKDGASIGRKSMFRDGFPHVECCINEHVFILRTNENSTQNFLYFWLDQPDMTQNIKNLNANAAQPGINQAGVKGLPILVPDQITLKTFDYFVDASLGLLFNLAKKNTNLRRTRDLLLPRLVSGEIDVSELEIAEI